MTLASLSSVYLCETLEAESALGTSVGVGTTYRQLFQLLFEGHLAFLSRPQFNLSHTIHHLSFGDTYPGQQNPLDGYTQTSTEDLETGITP